MSEKYSHRGKKLAEFASKKGWNKSETAPLTAVDTRGITLHTLRKTFCSYLASKNVPPEATMRIMGHSSLAVTMEYYSNVSLDMLRGRFDEVDQALNHSDQILTKVDEMGTAGNRWELEHMPSSHKSP